MNSLLPDNEADLLEAINSEVSKIKNFKSKLSQISGFNENDLPFQLKLENERDVSLSVSLEAKIDLPFTNYKIRFIPFTDKIVIGTNDFFYFINIPIIMAPQFIEIEEKDTELVDFVILENYIITYFSNGKVIPYSLKEWAWKHPLVTSDKKILITSARTNFILVEYPNNVFISNSDIKQLYNGVIGKTPLNKIALSPNGTFAAVREEANEILMFSINYQKVIESIKSPSEDFCFNPSGDKFFVRLSSEIHVYVHNKSFFITLYKLQLRSNDLIADTYYFTILNRNKESDRTMIFYHVTNGKPFATFTLKENAIISLQSQENDHNIICAITPTSKMYIFKVRYTGY